MSTATHQRVLVNVDKPWHHYLPKHQRVRAVLSLEVSVPVATHTHAIVSAHQGVLLSIGECVAKHQRVLLKPRGKRC